MQFRPNEIELKKAILEMGSGYTHLAKTANISSATVTKLINGKALNAKTCNKIAVALGKPVTELFIVE